MPHLRYCNRYWYIAGDELSVPALCSISARTAWTALITVVTAIAFDNLSGCSNGWVLQSYLIATIGMFVLSVICDGCIIHASLKGSIIESDKRVKVGDYLTVKFILNIIQLCFAGFGIAVLALGSSAECNESNVNYHLSRIFVGIVAVSQIIDSIVLFCCCYCLQATSSSKNAHNKDNDEDDIHLRDEESVLQLWESRCQLFVRYFHLLCCNLFGGNNIEEGFDQVAKVLTTFFHHDGFLDVVASDVVAGFILVRVEQRAQFRQIQTTFQKQSFHLTIPSPAIASSRAFTGISKVPSQEEVHAKNPIAVDIEGNHQPGHFATMEDPEYHNHHVEIESLHQGYSMIEVDNWYRCATYSLAMYTHLLALYMHPLTGICRITCCECMIAPCVDDCVHTCSPSSSTMPSTAHRSIEGDNCCRLNYYGMKVLTKDMQKNSELIHVSYKNDTRNKPYGIFLDHEKEWVVIAVRGTLSLEDCITDAICEPVELTEAGKQWGFDGSNRWAHGGFLRAATQIRTEIENAKLLHKIFSGNGLYMNGSGKALNMSTPLTERSGNFSNYKLIVTGHSLGAGTAVLLAWLLRARYPSLHCYSYGTPGSVIDETSCLEVSSFVTSVVLGNDLVSRLNFPALCRLRNDVLDAISRARVNKMFVLRAIFKDLEPSDLMYVRGEEPDSEFKQSVSKFKETINRKLMKSHPIQLSIPGKIVHFVKVKAEKAWCSNHPRYFPINSDLNHFREIVVSSSMGADHFPDQYYYETKKIRDYFMRSGYEV